MENYTNETPIVDETPIMDGTPIMDVSPVEHVDAVVDTPQEKNTLFSLLGFIAGLASVFLNCLMGSGLLFSIAAIVFFVLNKKKSGSTSGRSVVGLICGIIGLVIFVIWMIVLVAISLSTGMEPTYY